MHFFLSFVILFNGVSAGSNFIQLPISVERVDSASNSHTIKNGRVDTLPVSMRSSIYEYFVDFDIGSPPQPNKALIDTGSADIWVYGPESSGAPLIYNAKTSESSRYVNSDFAIQYADSTSSKGDFYEDVLKIGNTTVPAQFAVTDGTFDRYGKFGIAPINLESDSEKYLNFPASLKEQGLIEVNAYSLFLDDRNASTGSLLLGGIDRSLFHGPLQIVNTTKQGTFYVDVEFSDHRFSAEPDSGTTYTYIPGDILAAYASSIGAKWQDGKYVVDEIPEKSSLDFSFSGAIVTVNVEDLFIPDNDGYELTIFPNSQTSGMNLLGDSFLRSAYIVYSPDTGSIAIAQARYDGGESDIVPITADGIPGAVPAPGF